jgi:hypothetical protein
VAYELGKTVDEIEHLSQREITEWLAFFRLREKRIDEELAKRQRASRRR